MDAYRLLGLAPGASLDDVRMAYHRLALRHHPDHCPTGDRAQAEQRMTAINEARAQVLRDIYERSTRPTPLVRIPQQRTSAEFEHARRVSATYADTERLVPRQRTGAPVVTPVDNRWRDAVVPVMLAGVVAVGFAAGLPIPVLLALLGVLLIASALSLSS